MSDLDDFWSALTACEGKLNQLLDVIGRRVVELVGDGCVLTIVDPSGSLRPATVCHRIPEVAADMEAATGDAPIALGEGVVGTVAAERRPVVLNDIVQEDITTAVAERYEPFARQHPIRALAIVPLLAGGELVGTLGAFRTESGDPYTAEDVRLLEALGERAALAIAEATAAPRRIGAADYEALFRNSVDGLLITTPDGHVLAANPAACELFGLSERALVAGGREQVVVPDDPRLATALAERAAVGRVRSELLLRRGDGTTFVGDVTSAIFATRDGSSRACIVVRDVDAAVRERDAALQRLTELEVRADRDPLTGLWNRRGWTIAVEQAFAAAERSGRPSQVVFLDIDGLKDLNDRLGHAAGDAAILAVARALVLVLREVDVAGRFGGDEFVVLLVDSRREDVAAVMERVREAVAADASAPEGLTFTFGSVERRASADVSLTSLLESADRAMYGERVLRRLRRSGRSTGG